MRGQKILTGYHCRLGMEHTPCGKFCVREGGESPLYGRTLCMAYVEVGSADDLPVGKRAIPGEVGQENHSQGNHKSPGTASSKPHPGIKEGRAAREAISKREESL